MYVCVCIYIGGSADLIEAAARIHVPLPRDTNRDLQHPAPPSSKSAY